MATILECLKDRIPKMKVKVEKETDSYIRECMQESIENAEKALTANAPKMLEAFYDLDNWIKN